jgi:hypothetical protein
MSFRVTSGIPASSARLPRDFEDTLIFGENFQIVGDWYNRQACDGSTSIKTIQLRSEYAVPFHQFIVVQTRGEPSRAYRVDRGREREGWSVLDTVKKLGVPPRDTIALLQEPVEELDKTSQRTEELRCSDHDDKTIDLFFILNVGFRIHNNWGTRYNLLAHNCYFFARTIINTCDNRLGKESSRSKHGLKHVLTTLIWWLPLLLWAALPVLVLVLQRVYVWKIPGESGIGIMLGVVNMLVMQLAMMQAYVALAVRVVVAQVVQRERNLEQGGALEAVEWEVGKLIQQMPGVTVFGMLLVEGVLLLVPAAPFKDSHHPRLGIGFAIFTFIPLSIVFAYVYALLLKTRRVRGTGSGRPSDTRAEDGGVQVVDVGAATEPAKPEQEQAGIELVAREASAPG